jgi:hypothetical protein
MSRSQLALRHSLPVAVAALVLAAAAAARAAQASANAPPSAGAHALHGAAVSGPKAATRRQSAYVGAQHLAHADMNYALQWGIDSMQTHQTNAGNLIRFSYRVLDTKKAKPLIDKAAAPLMLSPRANVALQVPVMDKVGALRQSTELERGKTYWMVFSNKGNLVKPGDHVSVVVGTFRVDGLIVQ